MNKLLLSPLAVCLSLGDHFSAFAQEVKGDAKAGEAKMPCVSAATASRATRPVSLRFHKVPMISGQGAKYIVSALNAYKKGERKHPTMRGIADS
jgi:cytochrome c553